MSTHGGAQKHCHPHTQRLHEPWQKVHSILVRLQSLWIWRVSVTSGKRKKNFGWKDEGGLMFVQLYGDQSFAEKCLRSAKYCVIIATTCGNPTLSHVVQIDTVRCITTTLHSNKSSKNCHISEGTIKAKKYMHLCFHSHFLFVYLEFSWCMKVQERLLRLITKKTLIKCCHMFIRS